jgi:hypothetical protein
MKGEKPPFLFLPKPNSISYHVRENNRYKLGSLEWTAQWEDENRFEDLLVASQKKVDYWSNILLKYILMKKQYPDLDNIDKLIKWAKREINDWKKTTKLIRKQMNH